MFHPVASSTLLWVASALSLLGFIGHVLGGGRMFLGPLMADPELPVQVKWLGYVSWHVVPIVLMALSAAFGYAVTHPGNAVLAIFAGSMSAAVSILAIVAGMRGSAVLLRVPAPYLFGLIACWAWRVGSVAAGSSGSAARRRRSSPRPRRQPAQTGSSARSRSKAAKVSSQPERWTDGRRLHAST